MNYALSLVKQWPKFRNSRTLMQDDEHRDVGHAGELAFACQLQKWGIEWEPKGGHFDYDIKVGTWGIDVKTKRRSYSYSQRPDRIPLDEGHVQFKEDGLPHIFVFANFHDEVELLGWDWAVSVCKPENFVRKGDTDGSHVEYCDAWKVRYGDVRPMDELYDPLLMQQVNKRFLEGK